MSNPLQDHAAEILRAQKDESSRVAGVMRGANLAESHLSGLDKQYAQAEALRNTGTAKATGDWGGVLTEIGNIFRRRQGAKDMSQVNAAMGAERATVADGVSQQQQFENDTATRNLQLKDTQTQIAAQAEIDAAALAEKNAMAKFNMQGEAVNAKLKGTNDDTAVAVTENNKGQLVDPETGELLKGYVKVGGKGNTINNNNSSGGFKVGVKDYNDDLQTLEFTSDILKDIENMPEQAFTSSSDSSNRIKKYFIDKLPKSLDGFKAELRQNFAEESDHLGRLAQKVSLMTTKQRKIFFGTAVTNNEAASATGWIPALVGLSMEEVYKRTRLLNDQSRKNVNRVDSMGRVTSGRDTATEGGYYREYKTYEDFTEGRNDKRLTKIVADYKSGKIKKEDISPEDAAGVVALLERQKKKGGE